MCKPYHSKEGNTRTSRSHQADHSSLPNYVSTLHSHEELAWLVGHAAVLLRLELGAAAFHPLHQLEPLRQLKGGLHPIPHNYQLNTGGHPSEPNN